MENKFPIAQQNKRKKNPKDTDIDTLKCRCYRCIVCRRRLNEREKGSNSATGFSQIKLFIGIVNQLSKSA